MWYAYTQPIVHFFRLPAWWTGARVCVSVCLCALKSLNITKCDCFGLCIVVGNSTFIYGLCFVFVCVYAPFMSTWPYVFKMHTFRAASVQHCRRYRSSSSSSLSTHQSHSQSTRKKKVNLLKPMLLSLPLLVCCCCRCLHTVVGWSCLCGYHIEMNQTRCYSSMRSWALYRWNTKDKQIAVNESKSIFLHRWIIANRLPMDCYIAVLGFIYFIGLPFIRYRLFYYWEHCPRLRMIIVNMDSY